MKEAKTKYPDSNFVSPETKQHEPVPVDDKHASIEQCLPDPLEATQDGLGALPGHSQQPDQAPEDLGGEKVRTVKKSKVAERHVTSEPSLKVADRRNKHLKATKKQNEKVFGRGSKK